MHKILLIDDDEDLAWAIQKKFENLGFEMVTATEGREGVKLVEEEKPDLVILDLNLPDVDGLDICRYLRRRTNLPIVMLTGRTEEPDTIVGLEVGADDYVTKPFSLNELIARVRAVMRRTGPETIEMPAVPTVVASPEAGATPPRHLTAAGLDMDVEAKRVWVEGGEVQLTPTEFRLLQALLENQGKVCSSQDLLRAAWGEEEDTDTHLVEVHLGNLRSKIEKNSRKPERVKTVRGFGYRIDVDNE